LRNHRENNFFLKTGYSLEAVQSSDELRIAALKGSKYYEAIRSGMRPLPCKTGDRFEKFERKMTSSSDIFGFSRRGERELVSNELN
jgi:hypothetical protein